MNEKANAKSSQDASVVHGPVEKPAVSPLPGMLAIGTKIRQKVEIIEGTVKKYHMSDDGKTFSYVVTHFDAAGNEHEHIFRHDQIEEAQ